MKTIWKGGALLAPVPPVMVSCGTMTSANIITVAWTGIVNTHPPKTYISLRKSRYSYPIIKESGEFVINLTTAEMIKHADFCGIHTGRKVDKFTRCHFDKIPASSVSCPMIAQSPLHLECKVDQILTLGSHDMLLADIVAVQVDNSLLDKTGRLHLERAGLAAFAHGQYYSLGKSIGTFGFSVKKPKQTNRPIQSQHAEPNAKQFNK